MSAAKELRKKEYAGRKEQGSHSSGKPIVPGEQVGVTHSGRALPSETILKDSKIITSGSGHSGRLAKRNNV